MRRSVRERALRARKPREYYARQSATAAAAPLFNSKLSHTRAYINYLDGVKWARTSDYIIFFVRCSSPLHTNLRYTYVVFTVRARIPLETASHTHGRTDGHNAISGRREGRRCQCNTHTHTCYSYSLHVPLHDLMRSRLWKLSFMHARVHAAYDFSAWPCARTR